MTNGHPTHEEDFCLYVLGALDADEKQAIESHLAGCADCARRLAGAQGRIAAISFAAPRVEPSAGVRDRLLQQVRAHALSENHGEARDPAPAHEFAKSSARKFVPPEPPHGIVDRWVFAILASACVALLSATLILWRENDRLTKELATLGASVDKTTKELADQQKQLDYARNVAHLLEARDTITVSLAPEPGMGDGAVKVMYNGKMGMLMYDGWISPPPEDKSYQLWVVPMDGKPISVGVFNPATRDMAHWMTKVPQGVAPKMFAVTLEPAGGMPQPTGPMVMTGGT